MTHETSPAASEADGLYIALFEALSSNSILLKADVPIYTILAVTDAYLKATGTKKEDLIGKGIFEAFPANNEDPEHTGESDLYRSYTHVMEHKEPHYLPVQRYDLINENGGYDERYWRAHNKPVLSPEGEITYIIHTAEEITDQIKAAHRESQMEGIEKAYQLFMQVPGMVGVVRGKNYILELANESAFQLWGKGPEIIGKSLRETLPELKGQGVFELFDEVLRTGKPYLKSEVPITTLRSGTIEVRYFDLFYQPIYDNGSNVPVGVFTISNDVTEKVLAIKSVAESEAKFRTLAESTPVLITVGNEKGEITYYNKAWSDLTGKSTETLLSSDWADLINVEDRDAFSSVFFQAFTKIEPFTGEMRVLNAGGEYRWLFAHGVPRFTSEGSFVGYISACTDITEQKRSQEELQTALEQIRLSKEAAELGTFDLDLTAGTMHWDDRCRTLFGISHHEPVSYERDFVEGLHPEDKDRILEVINQAFIKSVSNGDYDVEYRTIGAEDGHIRWVRAKGKVYFNAQEKPVRFIGSVLDITAQKTALQKIESLVEERTKELAQANERLQVFNQELQRSNTNLEEFAHAASHDMKEPIRKVLTFSDRLKRSLEDRLTDTEQQLFSRVENATQRMGLLVDDLLEFSHVSERPLEKEEVNLNTKVKKVLMDLELLIEEKKAQVQVGQLPTIMGFKRQLQQLLQNLIGNALKYSKPNQIPVVTVTSKVVHGYEMEDKVLPEQANKSFYLIEVKDNGIGFEQEYAEKIFGMFQRLHGKAEYPGTGVGLSIARKVVENHNGYIWAESKPGEGALFNVLLPV